MTRKTATRGRKAAAVRPAKAAPRATTRTGKKTASARASKPAAGATVERKRPTARRELSRVAEPEARPDELHREPVQAIQTEDDEELDWLAEDEDPRSQIVEDEDDDWNPQHDDEW